MVDCIVTRDGDQADGQGQRSKVGLAAPLKGTELCAKSAATHGDPLIPNHQLQYLFDLVKCRVSESHLERITMKAALLLSLRLSGCFQLLRGPVKIIVGQIGASEARTCTTQQTSMIGRVAMF